ncbi:MAG: hypothetical protein JWO86_8650 [Myxococcaceae bacterium]|nr:hypothetical protein [Myxococcaceae bacterium]
MNLSASPTSDTPSSRLEAIAGLESESGEREPMMLAPIGYTFVLMASHARL